MANRIAIACRTFVAARLVALAHAVRVVRRRRSLAARRRRTGNCSAALYTPSMLLCTIVLYSCTVQLYYSLQYHNYVPIGGMRYYNLT